MDTDMDVLFCTAIGGIVAVSIDALFFFCVRWLVALVDSARPPGQTQLKETNVANIKHLKVDDEIVLRKINKFGRYEFRRALIKTIAATSARIAVGDSYHRVTGVQTGVHVTDDLGPWIAFPPTDPEIIKQLEELHTGTLAPAISPDRVRLIRAVKRIKDMTDMHELEQLGAAKSIIEWFGRPEDYKEPQDIEL